MKILIAGDHHGVKRKEKIIKYLEKIGYTVENYGTDTEDMVDFPEYAFKVAEAVQKSKDDIGILLCGTGIGMSIAANKVKGIRCAKIDSINDARLARVHNDANVIAMSSTKPMFIVKDMLDAFLGAKPSTIKRYKDRNKMIDSYKN